MKPLRLEEAAPKPQEYIEMRAKCGLRPRTLEAAEKSMASSLFAVCLRAEDGKLVGMGRVIGDHCHAQIVDIAVDPAFQKQGHSKRIMDRIMEYVHKELPTCTFVNLFADVDYLYQKYGFEVPKAIGMALVRK